MKTVPVQETSIAGQPSAELGSTRGPVAIPVVGISMTQVGWCVALTGLAFLLRMGAWLWLQPANLIGDMHGYLREAVGLAAGKPYESTFIPPGYPFLLAATMRLLGSDLMAACFLNAVLGSLAVIATFLAARALLGPSMAVAAAAVVALDPSQVLYATQLLSEPLALALGAGAVAALSALSLSSWRMASIVGGLWVGFGALTRESMMFLLPLVGIALWRKRGWRPALVFLVAGLLPIVPWTLRNRAVTGHTILVSSRTGYNLIIGNNPYADGTQRGGKQIFRVPNPPVPESLPPAERHVQGTKYAVAWITSHPLEFAGKGLAGALRMFGLERQFLYSMREGYYARTLGRVEGALLVGGSIGTWIIILPLAVLGMLVGPSWLRALGLCAFLWVGILGFVAFGEWRFRMPVMPIFVLLATAAGGAWARGQVPRRTLVLAGALVIPVLAYWLLEMLERAPDIARLLGQKSPAANLTLVADGGSQTHSSTYPSIADLVDPEVLVEHKGISVHVGYGSSLAIDPADPNRFYLLTDRGPNVDTGDERIAFLMPSFAPRIGHFRLHGNLLEPVSIIELKDDHGRKLSGLPRKPGEGGTGEVPEDVAGKVLDFDPNGVDPEGLVALRDGTFWISEEYGPSLLHLNANGQTLERLDPYGLADRDLPKVFRHRRPGRGMEGLAVTPDGKTLMGIMESSLDNPSKEVRKTSRVVRLLSFEIASGNTRQLIYLQESPELRNSEIATLSDTAFLVIERDNRRPGDGKVPSAVKRVYRIDISEATDVSDPSDGPDGRLVDGKTLEELSEDELRAAGIRPVTKSLVLDLLKLDGYPHDKPEGLAVIDGHTLAIANDSDFGVDDDGKGQVIPKRLPAAENSVDRTRIYFTTLNR
jgi:hypothetical protein